MNDETADASSLPDADVQPEASRETNADDRRQANGRVLAYQVLRTHRRTGQFVHRLLEEALSGEFSGLRAAEVRLATELAAGVVRRKATLNALVEAHSTRRRHLVEADLWLLLQLGVYQLVFLSVPAHAAVHETVELAKVIGRPRWTGFLNAVLRATQRSLTDQRCDSPAPNAVPLNGPGFRKLTRDVFPDPGQSPVEYFASAFSFPPWLARRWHRRFGTSELFRLGTWFNTPPRLAVRPNRLKITRDELLRVLDGYVLSDLPAAEQAAEETSSSLGSNRAAPSDSGNDQSLRSLDEVLWLDTHVPVHLLPGFEEGLFTVQDPVAMEAVFLLAPKPGEKVLDLCAGPGTKTTLLAELMKNSGTILATDTDADRLAKVEENCRRLGVENVQTQLIDEDGKTLPPGPFDAVLVDVPCSNTGVLGKRPEARWRVQPSDLEQLTALQRRLLRLALSRVRPGGRVVYSTCSIEPEENQQVVRHCLRRRSDCELVSGRLFAPGRPSDGGYQALIVRHKVV